MRLWHNRNVNWEQASSFFPKLSEGEMIEICWSMSVREHCPDVPLMFTGSRPSSQRVFNALRLQGIHCQIAKPLLYHGLELLTAPDLLMVVHGTQYAVEVKTKDLNPNYMNVILDEKEVSELHAAAELLQQEPLFVFHLRDSDELHPRNYLGEFDKRPPLSKYWALSPERLVKMRQWMTKGEVGYRVDIKDLTPVIEWLGVEYDPE